MKIDVERSVDFTIHNIFIIDILLKTLNIFNQINQSESILFKYSNLSTYCNYNFNGNVVKDDNLESYEITGEDISYQEV